VKTALSARETSIESLLLMIAYAKEEANRLELDNVAQMLELPELSVLQTYTGFEMDDIGHLETMTDALSDVIGKSN